MYNLLTTIPDLFENHPDLPKSPSYMPRVSKLIINIDTKITKYN